MPAYVREVFHFAPMHDIGIEIAECHHEKFDGSGHPGALKGDAIPLSARIIVVVAALQRSLPRVMETFERLKHV